MYILLIRHMYLARILQLMFVEILLNIWPGLGLTPELELESEFIPPELELELELIFWKFAGVGFGVGVETPGVGIGIETLQSWSWSWSWNFVNFSFIHVIFETCDFENLVHHIMPKQDSPSYRHYTFWSSEV